VRAILAGAAGLTLLLAAAPAGARPDPAPVIGGTDVPAGRWVDTAALLYATNQGDSAECTGVLIAPSVVLTAAHCVFDDGLLTPPRRVWIGTNSLAHPERGEDLPVQDARYHPGVFDLAVVLLARPSQLPPRRLATGWVRSDVVDGARVALAGYGAIDRDAVDYVDELREAESTITDAGCARSAGCEPGARPDGELGAGGMGVDTCPGDSGGPLYLLTPYGEFLAGITSRGYDDNLYYCSEGGIYVRPDKDELVAWIEQTAGVALPVGRGPRALEPIVVEVGETVTVALDADDPRAGTVHAWEIVGAPALGVATVDAAGVLTYAAGDRPGTEAVTVRASDSQASGRSAQGRITVEVVDAGCCRAGPAGGRVWPAVVVLAMILRRRRRTMTA